MMYFPICDYGCGREGRFRMTSGKICCENSYCKCPSIKEKNKLSNQKGHVANIFENQNNRLCDFGCKEIARYKFKNGKVCCKEIDNYCTGKKKRISKSNKGKKRTEEFTKLVSKNKSGKPSGMKGKKQTEYCKEFNRNRLLNGESKRLNSIPRDQNKVKIAAEKSRNRLLNGGAKYMHSFPCMGYKSHTEWMKCTKGSYQRSFIKKISKEEFKIKEMVKELYPEAEPQYPVLGYDIDVALVQEKIAIEYDGYYHFDTEEHKEYHKLRQERIEQEGWKFIRYTMFDKFPSKEQVLGDIQKLL